MKDAGGVYDFSACVYQYESRSEGISFGDNIHSVPVIPDEVTAAIVKGVYTRKIGDVIPDELISMSDVTESLGIVSFLNSCTTANVAKNSCFEYIVECRCFLYYAKWYNWKVSGKIEKLFVCKQCSICRNCRLR